jgi:hypothetical protein
LSERLPPPQRLNATAHAHKHQASIPILPKPVAITRLTRVNDLLNLLRVGMAANRRCGVMVAEVTVSNAVVHGGAESSLLAADAHRDEGANAKRRALHKPALGHEPRVL